MFRDAGNSSSMSPHEVHSFCIETFREGLEYQQKGITKPSVVQYANYSPRSADSSNAFVLDH